MGREQEARAEAAELIHVSPWFSVEQMKQMIPQNWEDKEHHQLLADLRKAGLKVINLPPTESSLTRVEPQAAPAHPGSPAWLGFSNSRRLDGGNDDPGKLHLRWNQV